MNWKKIWNWLEHHRFTIIGPVVGLIIWIVAIGCVPMVQSPINPEKMVNAAELQVELDFILAKFELAGEDLASQAKAIGEVKGLILSLASGNIADWSGLLTAILGGSWLGLAFDRARADGVIGGLKRNLG